MSWRQARVRLTDGKGQERYLIFKSVDEAREFVFLLPMAQVYERLYLDVWKAIVVPLEVSAN